MNQIGTAPLATGATDALVEMVAEWECLDKRPREEWADQPEDRKRAYRLSARNRLSDLVPPGFVIVPATAVIGSAERSAWDRLLEAVDDLLDTGADSHDLDRFSIEVTTWTVTNLREARSTLTALLGRTGEGESS